MDFADATLVHLAKRESLSTIFRLYQCHDGRRRFRVLPVEAFVSSSNQEFGGVRVFRQKQRPEGKGDLVPAAMKNAHRYSPVAT